MAAHFGRRLRKGAVTTAVAAAAVAALSASQAPDVTTTDGQERQSAADAQATPDPTAADAGATGNSPYYTDLPPLNSPTPVPSTTVGPTTGTGTTSQAGIPATVLDAYQRAAAELTASKPGCNLPWQLLAAIGQVESGQARGGRVTADGTTVSPILGPVLNGVGFAHIKDTDHGAYDGDATYDRAIGPLQFIPSTWAWAGRDGNGDGKADPNNVYDAALAAGHYLCRNGWDLSVEADLKKAILSYNYSQDYLHTVRSWMEFYRRGTHEIPDGSGSLPGNRSDEHDTPMSPSVPVTPSPAPKPSKPGGTTKPSTPATPSKPGTPSTPSTPTPSPTPTPTPTDTVAHIEDAGTATLSAGPATPSPTGSAPAPRPRPASRSPRCASASRSSATRTPPSPAASRTPRSSPTPRASRSRPRCGRARRPATSPSAPCWSAGRSPPSTTGPRSPRVPPTPSPAPATPR